MASVMIIRYGLQGALQDNWSTYYSNIAYRAAWTVLFVSNGGELKGPASMEVRLARGLGATMMLSGKVRTGQGNRVDGRHNVV